MRLFHPSLSLRMPPGALWWGCLVALFFLGGCEWFEPTSTPSPAPTPQKARRPETVEVPGATRALVRFTLNGVPAQHYSTSPPGAADEDLVKELRAVIPSLRYDPCLSRAAETYAAFRPHEPEIEPPRPFLEFALHWAGCPDSSASVRLFYTSEDGREGLREYLARVLESVGPREYVGLGRAPSEAPYRWTWAVLLSERKYQLTEPFPRSGAVGSSASLEFALAASLSDPEVLEMAQGNDIREVDVTALGKNRYSATIQFGPEEGEQWVEILAKGPLGPEVVALFPVHVDEPLPRAWQGMPPPNEAWIESSADAEKLMLELLNQDRARHGLMALEVDTDLADVARGHSRDMRDQRFFAHVSPARGDLSTRLREADYAVRFSAENIAKNASMYDAEVSLMESLGHRANILSPEVTHVGIGVVSGKAENGQRVFFITQNFARPIREVSVDEMYGEIARRIKGERQEAGLRGLDRPAVLDSIAKLAAEDAVERGFEGDRLNGLIRQELRRAKVPMRPFRLQYQTLCEPEDFHAPQALGLEAVSSAGIGVARTKHESGARMLAVLLVLLE